MLRVELTRRGWRRLAGFGALAAALHGVVVASLRRESNGKEGPTQPGVAAIETDVIIELPAQESRALGVASSSTARAANVEPSQPATAPDRAVSAMGNRETGGAQPRFPVSESSETTVPSEPAVDAPATAGSREPWVFSPLQTGATIVASSHVDSAAHEIAHESSSVTAHESSSPAGRAAGGLTEGLDAHDAAMGLGRSGPMLASLEGAAEATDAPVEGVATFDVGVDAGGRISVALLDASNERAAWARVGEAAEHAIDPAHVRLPPGARGWHAVVRIEALKRFADGVAEKSLGTKFTASPAGLAFTSAGKICTFNATVGFGAVGLGGGCDFSRIGAQPLRIVHGRVVGEGRL